MSRTWIPLDDARALVPGNGFLRSDLTSPSATACIFARWRSMSRLGLVRGGGILRGRRYRHGDQPDDRRRSNSWRRRTRCRPGNCSMGACRMTPGRGQLLSGSFMDYAVPRADDLPNFIQSAVRRGPTLHAQSAGRQGLRRSGRDRRPGGLGRRCARCASFARLVDDDIEMPLTPERVWRAMATAGLQDGYQLIALQATDASNVGISIGEECREY